MFPPRNPRHGCGQAGELFRLPAERFTQPLWCSCYFVNGPRQSIIRKLGVLFSTATGTVDTCHFTAIVIAETDRCHRGAQLRHLSNAHCQAHGIPVLRGASTFWKLYNERSASRRTRIEGEMTRIRLGGDALVPPGPVASAFSFRGRGSIMDGWTKRTQGVLRHHTLTMWNLHAPMQLPDTTTKARHPKYSRGSRGPHSRFT